MNFSAVAGMGYHVSKAYGVLIEEGGHPCWGCLSSALKESSLTK